MCAGIEHIEWVGAEPRLSWCRTTSSNRVDFSMHAFELPGRHIKQCDHHTTTVVGVYS